MIDKNLEIIEIPFAIVAPWTSEKLLNIRMSLPFLAHGDGEIEEDDAKGWVVTVVGKQTSIMPELEVAAQKEGTAKSEPDKYECDVLGSCLSGLAFPSCYSPMHHSFVSTRHVNQKNPV